MGVGLRPVVWLEHVLIWGAFIARAWVRRCASAHQRVDDARIDPLARPVLEPTHEGDRLVVLLQQRDG